MKFLSLNNFIWACTAFSLATLAVSDNVTLQFTAWFFLFYGLLVINGRIMTMIREKKE